MHSTSNMTHGHADGKVSPAAENQCMSPSSAIRQSIQKQKTNIGAARKQLQEVSALLEEFKRHQQPREMSARHIVHTGIHPRTRAAVRQVLGNITTNLALGKPQTKSTESARDEMPGNVLHVAEEDEVGSFVVLPNGRTARIERVETNTHTQKIYSALSPNSTPGNEIVLPNGKKAVITRVEVSENTLPTAPSLHRRTDRSHQHNGPFQFDPSFLRSGFVLSPTSTIGAEVMMPDGRVGVVTRVEVSDRPTTAAHNVDKPGNYVVLPNGKTGKVTRVEETRTVRSQSMPEPVQRGTSTSQRKTFDSSDVRRATAPIVPRIGISASLQNRSRVALAGIKPAPPKTPKTPQTALAGILARYKRHGSRVGATSPTSPRL